MAEVCNVGVITRELSDDRDEPAADPNAMALRQVPPGVEVYEVQGPFFFGAADRFKDTLWLIESQPAIIILRLRSVPAIDATGLHTLREFCHRCRRQGVRLLLSGVHTQPLFALERYGLLEEIGEKNIFGNIDDALNRARALRGLEPVEAPGPFVPTVAREESRPVSTD